MKILNKMNLPDNLVRAVTFSDYNRGEVDYSVTGLLNPPRILALKEKHKDELVEDASDRIWAAIGSAAHELFRRSGGSAILEKRFFCNIAGKRISGQVDYIGTAKEICDFKITSVWSMKGEAKKEWEQQLNIYRWMCAQHQIEVNKLRIIAIGRDWSKREATRDADYPQAQVVVFDLPVWDLAETERFIRERIALHEAAKTKLPECSPEDRWQKDDCFAMMKNGRKTAVKLHWKRELAELHLQAAGKGHFIQERKGTSIRCESYCSAAPFCEQWKALKPPEAAPEETGEAF